MKLVRETICINVIFSLFLLSMTGCRTADPDLAETVVDIVWPAPPAEMRVKYVKSFKSSSDLGFKTGWFVKVLNFVTGSEKGRERFIKPFDLCFDEKGNICVADTGSMSVHFFDFERGKAWNWKRIGGERLVLPVSVAKRGDIFYVADSALGKVLAFDKKGRVQFEIAERLSRPVSLDIADNNLFIADSKLHKIFIYDLEGKYISEFGKRGGGNGEFNYPTHIAVDSSGRCFVTDSMNQRVQITDQKGGFIAEIGSAGDSSGHFSRPKGIAPDNDGRLYVVDAIFDNIQIFDDAGRFLMVFGSAGTEPGEFWMPIDVEYTSDRQIYVTDTYNRRIQIFEYIGK